MANKTQMAGLVPFPASARGDIPGAPPGWHRESPPWRWRQACRACFPDLFDAAVGRSPVFPLAQCVPAVLPGACSQVDFCLWAILSPTQS